MNVKLNETKTRSSRRTLNACNDLLNMNASTDASQQLEFCTKQMCKGIIR